MRALLLTVGSSSIVFPPNSTPTPPHHHSTKPKSKPSLPSKHSPSRPPPPSSPSSTASPPPLVSAVRWDSTTSRRRNRLRYYADVGSKLAEDGRLEDFLMVAETVVDSGLKPSQFVALLNSKLVYKGITRRLKEEKLRSVVEVLSGLKKLGISPLELFDGSAEEALAQECRRIMKCGELEEFISLMELLAGCQFSIKELVEPPEIIKICVKEWSPNVAVRYARIFPNPQILFCTMILEFGKTGDLASALAVFKASQQKQGYPNMYAYRTMIDVCGRCGDYLKSRSIYEELLVQKVTPNIYVFNSLMNANAHDLSYTLDIYKHMQTLGVAADMASYNILLKSCRLAARVDLAKDIYREVQSLESTGALKLDVFTYSTIIKVFADAKLWQMALQIKEDMLSAGVIPNTVAWSSLISACASAGLLEKAIQLFEEMLLAGCEPNSQCCNIILHACVEACQYDRAFRLFWSWKRSGLHKAFFEDYQGKADSNGRVEHAHTLSIPKRTSDSHHLRFKVPFTPTTSTYNILMKACGSDYYHAKTLMDEMKTVGLSPNLISWSILIDVCGGSGNVQGAVKILKSMREARIQPDVVAYTAVIKVCVESKNLQLAFSVYAEMKRYQIKPNLVTYNTLLRARSRYGSLQEVQQCLAIYQDMRRAGYKSNDYYLKQLIEEWCEGVIQNKNKKQGKFGSCSKTDLGGPQSLLLEKVAAHLQKSSAESLAIDLQGLTKVEARIVVLAVLRKIKENYSPGDKIKDDMLIILGVQELGAVGAKHESGVKDAIIKLLQDNLGLKVLLKGHKTATERKIHLENPFGSYSDMEEIIGGNELPPQMESPTRRPAALQRLKVTKESLNHWLQRRWDAC
ncbi:unnamed protein product [Ilex paraguariensis]|uniref:Pentatricopeptide repeat-containing protein n=1 Tax=Ilex paraguariensis TaxID=185542 RepID=A0ABC8R024_9AQUA